MNALQQELVSPPGPNADDAPPHLPLEDIPNQPTFDDATMDVDDGGDQWAGNGGTT